MKGSKTFAYASLTLPAMSSALRMSPHPFPKSSPTSASRVGSIDLAYVESHGTSTSTTSSRSTSATAPTLLIHGLDSSSHTWRGVQQSLSTPSVAIDCRGCGRSALGDPLLFSPEAIVEDVKKLVDTHPLLKEKKFVVVGHSMGGRVGMCYAAKYPNDVAALIVEDMDIRKRSVESNFLHPNFDAEKAIAFERQHDSLDSVRKAFGDIGYPPDMLEKWVGEGRIYENSKEGEIAVQSVGSTERMYWSEVNPAFRALCYQTFFDSTSGTDSWAKIAEHLNNGSDIAIHLMVAGIGTVCNEESIEDMRNAVGDRLIVKTYAEGTHSIHNSAREEFMKDLKRIVREAGTKSE